MQTNTKCGAETRNKEKQKRRNKRKTKRKQKQKKNMPDILKSTKITFPNLCSL